MSENNEGESGEEKESVPPLWISCSTFVLSERRKEKSEDKDGILYSAGGARGHEHTKFPVSLL